ncbi:MAG: hypothetical protein VKI83_10520 [Synechococcaceae cyanobacterium]|nr:hypothetical protein [Synechococcaceae cyanobacterium]
MPAGPLSAPPLPPPASHSDLPAPWQNPWHVLGRDLVAAVASLRLKARELIRRNGEGEFAALPFWPPALRALFWPLLLAGIVLLPALVVLLLQLTPSAPAVPTAQAAPKTIPSPPSAAPSTQQAPEPAFPPLLGSPLAVASQASGEAPPAAAPADPLLLALQQAGGDVLIDALLRRPEQAALELTLSAHWSSLASEGRQRQAQDWLALVRSEGWETLLLVDGQGRQLGRPAAVGSGMILLDPSTL